MKYNIARITKIATAEKLNILLVLNKEYEIMEKFNTDVDASLILPISFPEYVDPQLKDDMVSSFFFVNFFCDRVN